MATLAEVQVKISADLAPLSLALSEAKRMTAGLDKELNKTRKIVIQQFDAQKQINSILGIDKAFKDASNSAAIFSNILSKTSLNPLLSAYDSYRQKLIEINTALASGVIDQSLHAQATLKAKGAYDQSLNSIRSNAAALESLYGIQSKINATFENKIGVERDSSDIQAYGQALDNLRSKFDPVFAASKNYENQLNELNRAMSTGAIPNIQLYEAALERLNSSYIQENAVLSKNTAALQINASARKQISFALGKQINDLTGVRSGSQNSNKGFKSAEESAKALQSEFQKLREKLLPLEAATRRYAEAERELNLAQSAGVITEDEKSRQLLRHKTALQNMTVLTQSQTNAQKLNNQQSLNMYMQLNDISVMMASGQNPFVMMMQQGMQIGQVYQQAGIELKNAGPAMLASITGFLTNPINIAVLAVATLAGTIPMIWEAFQGPEPKKAEEILDGVRSLLDKISESSQKTGDDIDAAFKKLNASSFSELQAGMQSKKQNLSSGIVAEIDKVISKYGEYFDVLDARQNEKYDPFLGELKEMQTQLKEGKISFAEFSNAAAQMTLNPEISARAKEIATSFFELSKEGREMEARLLSMNSVVLSKQEFELEKALQNLQTSIDAVNSENAKKDLEELKAKIEQGKIPPAQLREELTKISQTYIQTGQITSEIFKIADAAISAAKAVLNLRSAASKTSRLGSPTPLEDKDFNSRFKGVYDDDRINRELREKIGSSPKEKKPKKPKKPKDLTDEIKANKEFVENLQKEIEILGVAVDKRADLRKELEFEKQLKTDLSKLSETMGPKEIKQVEEMIRFKSMLIEEEKKLKEIQKEQFEAAGEYGSIIGSAISGAISGTQTLEQSLIKAGLAFAEMAIQAAVLEQFGKDSPVGNFTKFLTSSIFGGFRAEGGRVESGKAYMTGEKGRELVVPTTNGVIIPNNKIDGSNANSKQTVQNNYSSSYNITGSKSDAEMIRKELEKRDRKFQSQVISSVKNARSKRQLNF